MLYALLGRLTWFVIKLVVRRRAGGLARRGLLVVGAATALGVAGVVAARRR